MQYVYEMIQYYLQSICEIEQRSLEGKGDLYLKV